MKTNITILKSVLAVSMLLAGSSWLNAQLYIESVSSGAWNNPLVWDCNCVPTSTDDVHINQFNFVQITDVAYVNNLEIDPNSELTIQAGQELHVKGNADIIGTLNASAGHLFMDGTTEQYVDAGGNTLNLLDLTINNENYAVTFYGATYRLNGTLYPLNGGLILDNTTSNQFIFSSYSETNSARIDKVGVSFWFDGAFTVERNIPAGATGIRNVSASVKDATVSMWDETVGIYGSTLPDGCAPWLGTCENTMSYQDAGNEIPVTSITDTASTGLGFDILLGDDSVNFSGATLSMTGFLNDNIEHELIVSSGWDTKGNPYVSPIDFNKLVRTGVSNYFYVYSTVSGSYEWYDGTTNTASCPELANGIIATGQGFYVSGPGTLLITDTAKVESGVFMKTDQPEQHGFLVQLTNNQTGNFCTMSLASKTGASYGFDQNTDILHLSTGKEKASSIGVVDGDQIMRKNYFEANGSEISFDLYTNFTSAGEYTISLKDFATYVDYNTILLTDWLTGETINLKEQDYHFGSEAGMSERFTLTLSNNQLSTSSDYSAPASVTIAQSGSVVQLNNKLQADQVVQVYVYDMSGHVTVLKYNHTLSPGVNTVQLPETHGVNLIVVETETEKITQKIIQ